MYSLLEFDYSRLFYFYLSISLVISCWIVLLTLPYFISHLEIFHSGFWVFRDGPLDDLLEGLKDRLKTTVLSSKENGTVMLYNRAFCRWNQISANDKLNGKAFPANPFHVTLYLQHFWRKPTPLARSILLSMALNGPVTWQESPPQLMTQLLKP